MEHERFRIDDPRSTLAPVALPGFHTSHHRSIPSAWQNSLTARFVTVIILSWMPMLLAVLLVTEDRAAWFFGSLAVACVIAAVGGVFVASRLDLSIQRLERATERFARGELDLKVYPSRIPQLAKVAHGLNTMGTQLKERVDALVRLGGEQDAILQGMIEGVMTIDSDGRVMRANDAAKRLLEITVPDVRGKLVEEVIHHIELQRFVRAAVDADAPVSDTLRARIRGDRALDVYSSPLSGTEGEVAGTLVVFHDVTKLLRLENVRRDFVANVSHELKTPITSIKGFVETLLDGALDDPETLRKFLGIIARHADRLNAIFNDLLTLARLEAEGEDALVETVSFELDSILSSAIETCSSSAKDKGITLVAAKPTVLRVLVNPSLFEQAVVNLLDNGVKYTEPGGIVTLCATADGEWAIISITDTGCGIEPTHIPRLFERFYRIDQGRSRKMGGTGLGLSIVKHIAQVHGGSISVQSAVARGSTFTLRVRIARSA